LLIDQYLEQVRALLGHARLDTTQIYTSIRPAQLERAVSFYEEKAVRILTVVNHAVSTYHPAIRCQSCHTENREDRHRARRNRGGYDAAYRC